MPFNAGQLKAIQQRDSSILVSAPAGSGKTKILVSRIIELLKEGYEISDFLYHVMVLMVLRGVTWEDIVKELANR